MITLRGRNVGEIWPEAVAHLRSEGERFDSRAGEVIVSPEPVTTVYEQPLERVLLDAGRRANVWFHVFESLWMLAGRRDATMLDRWVSDFSSRFAEEDGDSHGAYGWRWRNHFDMDGGGDLDCVPDQLSSIIRMLRANPLDRRVVLQMWDAVSDLGADVRDVPCNTQAYFRIHGGALHMAVTCRSNDIVWGAYGANVFHFSVLLEYMASMVEVDTGTYTQFSWNWHGYTDVLDRMGDPSASGGAYSEGWVEPYPLVSSPERFDTELDAFLRLMPNEDLGAIAGMKNDWFREVGAPLWMSWELRRDKEQREYWLDQIMASDIQMAARQWIEGWKHA